MSGERPDNVWADACPGGCGQSVATCLCVLGDPDSVRIKGDGRCQHFVDTQDRYCRFKAGPDGFCGKHTRLDRRSFR